MAQQKRYFNKLAKFFIGVLRGVQVTRNTRLQKLFFTKALTDKYAARTEITVRDGKSHKVVVTIMMLVEWDGVLVEPAVYDSSDHSLLYEELMRMNQFVRYGFFRPVYSGKKRTCSVPFVCVLTFAKVDIGDVGSSVYFRVTDMLADLKRVACDHEFTGFITECDSEESLSELGLIFE